MPPPVAAADVSDAMIGMSTSAPIAAMVVITSSSCLGEARDNMTLAVFSADDKDMYIYLEVNLSMCCTGWSLGRIDLSTLRQ